MMDDKSEFDELECLMGELVRLTGELCYAYKNRHRQNRLKQAEVAGRLAYLHYKLDPSLIPFAGGIDRAELLGMESATNFASRKWAEQEHSDRHGNKNHSTRHNSRHKFRNGSMLERLAAKSENGQMLETDKTKYVGTSDGKTD